MPTVVATIPPAVISIPAALAFCVQVAAPVFCLMAAFTVLADSFIQLCLTLFNLVLAL